LYTSDIKMQPIIFHKKKKEREMHHTIRHEKGIEIKKNYDGCSNQMINIFI